MLTRVGPYPRAHPTSPDTWIESECSRCGITLTHNEYRDSMEHTIACSEHEVMCTGSRDRRWERIEREEATWLAQCRTRRAQQCSPVPG